MSDSEEASVNWYAELGDLIDARGKSWFPSALQAALQEIFHYDFFLLVIYEKGRSANVLRSDFRREQMSEALAAFQERTFVVDPVFRHFASGDLEAGVYDVKDLIRASDDLKQIDQDILEDVVIDDTEVTGVRMSGWPDHLQETCIAVQLSATNLVSIGLYNAGLERDDTISVGPLSTVFPALSRVVSRHFETTPWPGANPLAPIKREISPLGIEPFEVKHVTEFFRDTYSATVTKREAEVFAHLLHGMTATATADSLGISLHTAKTHRRNVYRRIGQTRLTKLIRQYHVFSSI